MSINVYTVKKGDRKAKPYTIGLLLKKQGIGFRSYFDNSCKYDTGKNINVLFGIGYFPGQKTNSIKIGWKYLEDDKIQLIICRCIDKLKLITPITTIRLFNYVDSIIEFRNGNAEITIRLSADRIERRYVYAFSPGVLGYPLGLCLGGDKPAPHDIHIELQKLL